MWLWGVRFQQAGGTFRQGTREGVPAGVPTGCMGYVFSAGVPAGH